MRAVIQRVKEAQVEVKDKTIGKIGPGLLVFLAVHPLDTEEKACALAQKIVNLRIMADQAGKMNLSVKDTKGEILVVSQFTLYADTRKGNRPGFTGSAIPEIAIPLYEYFVTYIKEQGVSVATGEFGAIMEVKLVNDGPVTMILEIK